MTRVSRTLSFFAVLFLMFSVVASPASALEADGQVSGQGSVDQEEGEKQDEPRVDEDGEGQEDPETKEDVEADEDDETPDPASPGATTQQEQGVAARGTVKIEETPILADTPNEVHAGCNFGLSFFGFGEQTAPVLFTLQPPSGTDQIGRHEVALQESQGNGLSGTLAVDLTDELAGYAPVQSNAYDYKIRVDVVVAQRGESSPITKTAMVFLDCPEAAARALAAGFERLPVAGETPPAEETPPAGETSPSGETSPAGEASVSAQGSGGARVPVGGVATGAGGTAGDGFPVAPLSGLAALVLAFIAVLRLRSASTS